MAKERALQLNRVLSALDNKDREFYDSLNDDEKKEFSGFLILRYCSVVQGDPELEHYYLASTNHYANKYMFELAKHPKLQWLMLTAASPGLGDKRHTWLKPKPKPKNTNASLKKEILELFPAMKEDDAEVLSTLITKKELNEYIKDHGE